MKKNEPTQPAFFFLTPHLTVLFLLVCSTFFAQTVTDVFPTRVTYQTKVTVIGTGFTSGTSISIAGISVINVNFVSATEMTFEINRSSYTTNLSEVSGTSSADITGELTVGSATGIDIEYVAPVYRILQNNGGTNPVTKITEIYTTLNGFWRSSSYNPSDESTWPNDSHDLLGYKYNGIIYSTGVDNDLLEANLGTEVDNSPSLEYVPQNFKAYSTNGVEGVTHSGNFLVMGDLIDNDAVLSAESTAPYKYVSNLPDIDGLTVYDVIVDGVNGLDLGTGITNFNKESSIRFFSGNGQVGAVTDDVPDLLITQVAQPGGYSGYDVYYYADVDGNVVGRPVRLVILHEGNGSGLLAHWKLDLYKFSNGINYDGATPTGRSYTTDEDRGLRMVAFKLEEFGIDSSNIDEVNNINMMAGGSSDMAFLAYNKSAFDIKAPVADPLLSRYICRLPSTDDITFSVSADIDGGGTGASEETLSYEWLKYNEDLGETGTSLTISDIDEDDLGTYKVKISNDYGTIIVPVTISEGGTPTYWNGSGWQLPQAYIDEGITVEDKDRSLIFSSDYSGPIDSGLEVEGCDCTVPAGSDVVIPSGVSLKLYGSLTVEDELNIYDDGGNLVETIPAGTFTLNSDASLVQVKDVSVNENTGSINVKRNVTNLHVNDYVYWSSPVDNFNVSGISNTPTYQWGVNAVNSNGSVGNWVSASNSVMETGEGYIVRVPSSSVPSFTAEFSGVPNNGTILVDVYKSQGSVPADSGSRHWNLIGNPYPSAINALKFIDANASIEGRVDLWTHNESIYNTDNSDPFYGDFVYNYGNQYVTYNGTGSSVPSNLFDENIASCQGFFVKVLESEANTTSVSFTNDMRYDDSEDALDNSQFFRTQAEATSEEEILEKQLVWLSLVNESNVSSSALVGYVDGATYEKDRLYDAYVNNDGFLIYSLISEEKMVIQGRPLPFEDSDQVPLGIELFETGTYKIGIDNLQGDIFVEEEQPIFLEDLYLNVEHDLRASPYTFTGEVGVVNDRFILKYAANTLSVKDYLAEDTFVYVHNQTLNIKSSRIIKQVQIFDINGKHLVSYEVDNGANTFTSDFSVARGVYIVEVMFDNGVISSKKVIN